MVHLKNDLRSYRSAQQLYEALAQCLKEGESLDAIRVQDVVQKSEVSRATFYRNFDTLSDVLEWRCGLFFGQAGADYEKRPAHLAGESFLHHAIAYFMEPPAAEFLELLFRAGRPDLLYSAFRQSAGPYLGEQDNPYQTLVLSGIFTGLLQGWVEGGRKGTADDVCRALLSMHLSV